jgi:hypothetical protein
MVRPLTTSTPAKPAAATATAPSQTTTTVERADEPPPRTLVEVDAGALRKLGADVSNRPVVDQGGAKALDVRLGLSAGRLEVRVDGKRVAEGMPIGVTAEERARFESAFLALTPDEVQAKGRALAPAIVDAARSADRAWSKDNQVGAATFLVSLATLGVMGFGFSEILSTVAQGAHALAGNVAGFAVLAGGIVYGVKSAFELIEFMFDAGRHIGKVPAAEAAAATAQETLGDKVRALVLDLAATPAAAS